ncbi:EF-hand domain-containing protein, putative [Gryllus bimaculatus]|nr:EF-hand domain-containing protein, putative [Gryllus bimaculatus]
MRPYVLYYFLEDDTISVEEVHTPNDGRDPCCVMLRRMRLPRDWRDLPVDFPSVVLETTDEEVTSYYTPSDLVVGRTIFVLGRRFLLYDCDSFTRRYYEHMLHITQPGPVQVFEPPKPPKPIVLRYTAHLDPIHPEDEGRIFLIQYGLADGTLKITEPPIDNSGRTGVKFLKPIRVPKPGAEPDDLDFYSPADFYIGARIIVFQNHFIIDGCDLHVYRYMQDNPEKFPPAVVENVRGWLAGRGLLTDDVCARALEAERRGQGSGGGSAGQRTPPRGPRPAPPPPPELKTWEMPCPEPPPPLPCVASAGPAEPIPPDPAACDTLGRLAVEREHSHLGSQGEFPGGPA